MGNKVELEFAKGGIMRKLMRGVWIVVWLLAFAWIVLGLAVAADVIGDEALADGVKTGVDGFASEFMIDEIAGYSLPAFVLSSGLPLLLIASFFIWRNSRTIGAAKRGESESADDEIQDAPPAPKPSSKAMRREALAVSCLAFAAVFLLWNSRDLEMIIYPLRLFVTFVHEAGHALAALLTGGQVREFVVHANGSGHAVTAGGNAALVLPAGYLGAALFGSLLFLLGNLASRWISILSVALGVFMIGLSAFYARPDESGMPIALLIGLGYGTVIVLIGAKAPRAVNQFVLCTLAMMVALEAVLDLWLLVQNPGVGMGEVLNDAAAFSAQVTPLLPTAVVAFMWAGIAVAMLAAAVYIGALKPLRQELGAAVARES